MYYFIDSKSVGLKGLKCANSLLCEDIVCVIYTPSTSSIISSIKNIASSSKAKFMCIQATDSNKGVPINLAFLIGVISMKGVKDITIISKDISYYNLTDTVEKFGVHITVANSIVPMNAITLDSIPTIFQKRVIELLTRCDTREEFFNNLTITGDTRKQIRKLITVDNFVVWRRKALGYTQN